MSAAESRWRAERTQELLAQGVERFEALATGAARGSLSALGCYLINSC